jgi:hypothetical protein
MEIDKKIIIKLVQALEDLKKSLKDVGIENNDNAIQEEIDLSDKIIVKSNNSWNCLSSCRAWKKKICRGGKKIKKGDTVMI